MTSVFGKIWILKDETLVIVVDEPNSQNKFEAIPLSTIPWKNENPLRFFSISKQNHGGLGIIENLFPQYQSTIFISREELRSELSNLNPSALDNVMRSLFKAKTSFYYKKVHQPKRDIEFRKGESPIPYAGRVFDDRELTNLVDSSLEFWLTSGRYTDEFEEKLSKILNLKHALLVNSGSSANLVAFNALTSPRLEDRRIKKGDEVITVSAGFPSTVTPIVQFGAIPVFVDISLPTYNIDVNYLEQALSSKTKAVMIAHTLGNPFDLAAVKSFCDAHKLWLIEDNCDALGSQYFYGDKWVPTGSIGHFGTSSFYPPHHLTMGEGGAVYTNDPRLNKIAMSIRDWGRDCFCPSGHDNTCNKRFTWQMGELPPGYDHKYTYSHFGYNLKATDLQASIGCAQIEKLLSFKDARVRNWSFLRESLEPLKEFFVLPEANHNSKPSWFGFLLTVHEGAQFTRNEIVKFLESQKIQTRMLFAGNMIRHPMFNEMRKSGEGYRVIGKLPVTDQVMQNSFWIGVYPGMKPEMLSYMVEKIFEFTKGV